METETVELHAYPDADLAGSYDSTRATSGGFIHLSGVNTLFQLDWYSKRQTATSHSTTEAELISASKMLRDSLVPLMGLWTVMLDREITAKLFEDNASTSEVIKTGYSSKMRHLAKHHRISVGVVHELCLDPYLGVEHVTTDKQKGDLMTKGLAKPKHQPACRLVGLALPGVGLVHSPNGVVVIRSFESSFGATHACCRCQKRHPTGVCCVVGGLAVGLGSVRALGEGNT